MAAANAGLSEETAKLTQEVEEYRREIDAFVARRQASRRIAPTRPQAERWARFLDAHPGASRPRRRLMAAAPVAEAAAGVRCERCGVVVGGSLGIVLATLVVLLRERIVCDPCRRAEATATTTGQEA